MTQHPGLQLAKLIKNKGLNQKGLASLLGKSKSEVNELVKGKRNITILWDYLLHKYIATEKGYWIDLQIKYQYELFEKSLYNKDDKPEDYIVEKENGGIDTASDNIAQVEEKNDEFDTKGQEIKDNGNENLDNIFEEF